MPLIVVPHRKSKYWYLRGTIRGIPFYGSTKTTDRERAEEIRAKKENELLEQSIHGRDATATFMEAAVKYVKAGGEAKYLGSFDDVTGRWTGLVGEIGSDRLATITQDRVEDVARKLYPDALPETRNRQVFTPFVAVWRYAVGCNMCSERPWRRLKKLKGTAVVETKRRRGTHPVAYDRAANFVIEMAPAPAVVLTILFYTGLRPIELFALQCRDVMPADRWMVVRNSKTGEPRGIPMHEMLVPLLSALKVRGGTLVRTRHGQPIPISEDGGGQLKGAVSGAARRSGILDVSLYTARHTVSTQLVIQGVHPHIKDQILGHAVTDMSRHYTQVPQKPLIEAINLLPVIPEWASCPWMLDPIGLERRLPPATAETRRHQSEAAQRRAGTHTRAHSTETKRRISEKLKEAHARRRTCLV